MESSIIDDVLAHTDKGYKSEPISINLEDRASGSHGSWLETHMLVYPR